MAATSSTDDAAPPLPSAGVRTVVTYLIFIHFFFLLVSIKSKTVSSGLEQDLRQARPGLTPYVQYLGMDLSYMFHLTYYDPTDVELARETTGPQDDQESYRSLSDTEFYIEADILGPTGSVEKTILWPPNDLRPGARFRRFQRLISTAVGLIDFGNVAPVSDIAKGIADRLMAENQCRSLKLRFRRRLLPNLMLPIGSKEYNDEKARDPNAPENFPLVYKLEPGRAPTVFEITAIRTDDNSVVVTENKAGANSAAPSRATVPDASSAVPAPVGTGIGAVK